MKPLYPIAGLLLALSILPVLAAPAKKKKAPELSPIERYIEDAAKQARGDAMQATPGAIWTSSSPYADLAGDLRARHVNDLVTIVVAESASAVSTGATQTQRKSSATSSVTALGRVSNPTGALANLANLGSNTQLNGAGTTSRQTTLTTTLSARVTHVLPNGYLVVEGSKDIQVNSEKQLITVRGIIRPADLGGDNSVPSNRLAQMEIRLNGKGVVGDSIRRPFFLYRLLLGLLPF